MADFVMRNFHHFPIDKSSYDLKLELLEEFDWEEALELMKANKGFRSIYLKDPWRIIGRNVHLIAFVSRDNRIEKFGESRRLSCDPGFYLPLLKKTKSCEKFEYSRYFQSQQAIDTAKKILSNLDSIGEWLNPISELEDFNECFSNFKGQITERIDLNLTWYSEEQNDPTQSVISKVLETQLGMCKEVRLICWFEQFSMILKLFSKTNIEKIVCGFDETERFSTTDFEMVMRWIVDNGVPSQNREAMISIPLFSRRPDFAYDSLGKFLSTFPGMQRLPEDEFQDEHRYRRRIDDERDCVYVLGKQWFKAWHVPSQAQ